MYAPPPFDRPHSPLCRFSQEGEEPTDSLKRRLRPQSAAPLGASNRASRDSLHQGGFTGYDEKFDDEDDIHRFHEEKQRSWRQSSKADIGGATRCVLSAGETLEIRGQIRRPGPTLS